MNKVITSETLESTGYRCLFECVKQEGIEPIFNYVNDVRLIPSQKTLICQTSFGKENALITLAKKNKDIIKYLQEHESELTTLSFTDENVYNTLTNLLKDFSLVNLYLDNACRLEELKVEKIEFVKDLNSLPKSVHRSYCRIIPLGNEEIFLSKYYTDGKVEPKFSEEQANKYKFPAPFCQIPFYISRESEPSFVLNTEKDGELNQHRTIEIINFGFDGSKLPTEEEVQSYDIPKSLIKSNRNES